MPNVSACLVCQSTRLEHKFKAKGYSIARCLECGFCQALDPPSDAELEEIYQGLHVSHQRYRDQRAAARENCSRLSFVGRHLEAGSSLLDAGCASGDFLDAARQRFTVSGTDISQGAIASAKARFPELELRLVCGRLEDNPFSDQVFGAVCLWDVIEHVRDPVGVVESLWARIKPGGYLFLSTPDMGSVLSRAMRRHWAFMIPPLHLGYFSRHSFDLLFPHRFNGEVICVETRGKWTSLAFLFYKLGQIHPWLAPSWLMSWLGGSAVGRLNIYLPTHDIMYLAVRKPGPTS